ncbi:MAG: sarcosine oxidase subunit gamma, partial [Stappiaceae bacterium]
HIGPLTLSENSGLSFASVAARLGQEAACRKVLSDALKSEAPAPGKSRSHDGETVFWMGPDQWMVGAPIDTHEDLATLLAVRFGATASVTEQTGAWVCLDLSGPGLEAVMERLSSIDIHQMQIGDATRTQIEQIGCFVIRSEGSDRVRILGPSSSAKSLYHALTTAMTSVYGQSGP